MIHNVLHEHLEALVGSKPFSQIRTLIVQVASLLDLLRELLLSFAGTFGSGQFLPVCIERIPHRLSWRSRSAYDGSIYMGQG